MFSHRRGNVLLMTAFLMVGLMGLLAFAVDLGVVCVARNQAQRAADAAALAAGWELVNDERIKGNNALVYQLMRDRAIWYAQDNEVINAGTVVLPNAENEPDGDVVIGQLTNPADWSETLNTANPAHFNAVTIRIHRSDARNSGIGMFFSRIFGRNTSNTGAEATAIFDDSIDGFRVTEETGNSGLLPFVVHVDAWQDLILDGNGADQWSYSAQNGISGAADGLHELVMFPGGGNGGNGPGNGIGTSSGNGTHQITPGNFGTVDIGSANNSTSHLQDLILYGPTLEDLAYHGGQLALDPVTGTMELGGDTGMSVGMESAIGQVKGKGRTIFLYNAVTGTGNNTVFTIVGFVGVRIVDHRLTGGNKHITVQPAYVTDATALHGTSGVSYYVGQPIRLVR
ncbi:MAG: pilus assembly protein TadG-related protein [Planctomycetota bacterium]|nr:pilus assembly protein TadG-related protein [Planctomycetota bacterium]